MSAMAQCVNDLEKILELTSSMGEEKLFSILEKIKRFLSKLIDENYCEV